jgi:hypothetical protein
VRLLGGSVVQIPPRHEEDGLPLLARLRELTRGATMTKEQHPRSVAAENRLDGVGS